jgi:serine/threonine-protein kinase HipA
LLRDGDRPAEDQRTFMKTMILFWLLGATDGHAKNFSVFLSPGGRYRMTPLYDVISAQPSVDADEIRPNQFRLAMAVGDNRHYRINTIAQRHFVQTAQRAGVGEQIVTSIFEELSDTAIDVVRNTVARLPKDFPAEVAKAIQLGVNRRLLTIRGGRTNVGPK